MPEFDSRALWELLMLEGFQAGLAWIIVLRKRDAFRQAFRQFDPAKVARFKEADVERLMQNPGIIRARAKIDATIQGARVFLEMQDAGIDFSNWAWEMAGGKPIQNTGPVPAETPLSVTMSKELKRRGFKFVGPVIVYAWMQAGGDGQRSFGRLLSAQCLREGQTKVKKAVSCQLSVISWFNVRHFGTTEG